MTNKLALIIIVVGGWIVAAENPARAAGAAVPVVTAPAAATAPTAVTAPAAESARTSESRPAFEVNVLWPFFPGGLSDFKLLVPTFAQGELVFGVHSDFGWRNSRADNAGKVATLGAKLGYRQFIVGGLHIDATLNLGWRQERNNPFDGTTLNAFVGRLWTFAGYQHNLSELWYINARGGVGIHLWRTDRFGDKERVWIPAGDINLGVRL